MRLKEKSGCERRILLLSGAMPRTALHEACQRGDHDQCLLLVADHVTDVNARDNTWVRDDGAVV